MWLCAIVFSQEDSLSISPTGPATDQLIITGGVPEPEQVVLETNDTLDWRYRHSTKKATLLSALVPGAGQIYNRKYWKAPIVWAGIGVSAYFIANNRKQYRRYKDAYIAVVDNDPTTIDEFNGQATPAQLLNIVDTYRRWRDLSYIAAGAVYALNIIDASVDAHFVRFDVSPDLTMELGPSLPALAQGAVGLSIGLALH